MDINTIISFIGSVGFPIFMCVYLIKFMQENQDEMRDAINSLKEAVISLTEKINRKE